MDFGIRSNPPCGDCWENGHCSMNCGPAVPPAGHPKQREAIADRRPHKLWNGRMKAPKGTPVICVSTPSCETSMKDRLDKMAALMDDYWRGRK
jgi:hypothetical protein